MTPNLRRPKRARVALRGGPGHRADHCDAVAGEHDGLLAAHALVAVDMIDVARRPEQRHRLEVAAQLDERPTAFVLEQEIATAVGLAPVDPGLGS